MIFRYLPLLGITISLTSFLAFFTKSQVFLIHLIWFSFGLVAYYHYDGLKAILERLKWPLLIGLISSFLIGIVEWEYIFQTSNEPWILYSYTIIDTIYTAFVILTFLAFAKAFTAGSKQLINIGSKSYGIYLIHPIVIMITARIIYHVLPRLLAYPLVFYAIIILVGISVPVLMMVLTTKTPLNRFYELAFGRR
jgi:peptidoglycan/LPS O-acetylase OafA/YrhL